jgi:predicted GNAT family acetyltransferase
MSETTLDIVNNQEQGRYEVRIEGRLAFLEYRDAGGVRYYTHTEVPEALEGRGIASQLAKTALDEAQAQSLTIVPLCPFVRSYIRRHPQYRPLVKY